MVDAPVFLAVLAEPISCMVHGWELISPITVGAKILLMGGGVAGALWACTLHLQGHRDVMISEPIQSRLDQLRKLSWYEWYSGFC